MNTDSSRRQDNASLHAARRNPRTRRLGAASLVACGVLLAACAAGTDDASAENVGASGEALFVVGNVANGAIHDVQVSAFPFAGFDLTNAPIGDFQAWSRQGAVALTGRFDDDKLDDIVLIPTSLSPYWTTLPVAFSNGDGGFRVTNTGVTTFPAAARCHASSPRDASTRTDATT